MIKDDRERILGFIRTRLKGSGSPGVGRSERSPLRDAMPAGFGERFNFFRNELALLGGETVCLETEEDAGRYISERIGPRKQAFVYDEIKNGSSGIVSEIRRMSDVSFASDFSAGYDKRKLSGIEAAVSACRACIAETGTIVIENQMRLPAAFAVKLFVVARPDQLLASLDEVFSERLRSFEGSSLFLISGPSRTADIEKQLVTGVHGPKEVHVVFINKAGAK